MAGEWKETTLASVMDVKHGFAFPGANIRDDRPGDILLTPGNFAIGGGFKGDKFKYFDGEVPTDYVLNEGDLIVTMTDLSKQADTLGYPALVPKPHGPRFLHNQRLGKVLIKNGAELDKGFLFYLLRTAEYRHEVLASATGTTVKHTSPGRILAHKARIPSLAEQKAIAAVLGTLDEKIELNRRTSATLERIARVLFQSWFVDFDPVRANLDGRFIPRLDPKAAVHFPNHFEDSPLGKKPADWKITTLDNVLSVLETGGRPKGGASGYKTGIPSIGAESIVGVGLFDYGKTKFVPVEFYEGMRKGRIESRDVLLYKDGGRPGEYEPHVSMFGDGFPFATCCINEHVYRLRTKEALTQEYLYFWMTSELVLNEMRIKGTGVAIPGLNSSAVRSLPVLVPPAQIIGAFSSLVSPLITQLLANAKQSRTLASTRDTLLPRLLSGSISAPSLRSAGERVLQ